MHGKGEYIWKAFYNTTFAFPVQTIYRGEWAEGKRSGEGTMYFGDESGLKLKGKWDDDFKHGDGLLVCGNGRVVEQTLLFQYDKPTRTESSASSVPHNLLRQILDVPVFNAPEFVQAAQNVRREVHQKHHHQVPAATQGFVSGLLQHGGQSAAALRTGLDPAVLVAALPRHRHLPIRDFSGRDRPDSGREPQQLRGERALPLRADLLLAVLDVAGRGRSEHHLSGGDLRHFVVPRRGLVFRRKKILRRSAVRETFGPPR
jgi:hypothetical protein